MDEKITLPTIDQLKQIQKDNPDTVIIPLSKQEWDNTKHLIKDSNQTESFIQSFANNLETSYKKQEFIERLEYTPIKTAIDDWLDNLSTATKETYKYIMQDFMKRKIIPEFDSNGMAFTVGHFNHVPHELIIDHIKKMDQKYSESSRQTRAACYISFTANLHRISQGWFRKAIPNTLASNPTFFQIRDKCATNALTLTEWHRFIDALNEINKRDSLIARCLLQGAKRITEAINITLDQIEWDKNIIRFKQSKTGGMIREIPITYPSYFMNELKQYIEDTSEKRKDSPFVFITRNGNVVTRFRLNFSFAQASKKARLKTKVTPHVLRATWVTIVRQQGVSDSGIMAVTGHRSHAMIVAYDKSSDEQNVSKKITLI